MTHLLVVAALAFGFGAISKSADLMNEHGMRWFRHSSPILGLIWGILGAALVVVDQWAGVIVVATTLYWFLRIKLEYVNHALAGTVILLTALWTSADDRLPLAETSILLGWLALTGYLNTWLKERYKTHTGLQSFLRLRLRYYVVPVAYTAITGRWTPAVAILFGMAATEIVTIWFDRASTAASSRVARRLRLALPRSEEARGPKGSPGVPNEPQVA